MRPLLHHHALLHHGDVVALDDRVEAVGHHLKRKIWIGFGKGGQDGSGLVRI
jgi:hypothetical protein